MTRQKRDHIDSESKGRGLDDPALLHKKGSIMKCEIFAGRDWEILEELISGFLNGKKLIEMKQSVVRAGFFDSYHLLVITIIYEEV